MKPWMPLAALLACLPLPARAAEELQAGAARIDITPPTGHAMWGYAARKDAPCEGVLEPLQARALVLAVGTQRLALVSLDLGRAPTRTSMAAIRAAVRKSCGVEHILLVASHTHHGPVLELADWPSREAPYVRQLESKLATVVEQAARELKPARLGVASRQAAFNRNRHSRRPDAPVDRELLVLRVEDRQGKPIAHAVNFAAHPTMLEARMRKFAPDYPGPLAALMEKETGVPCLFLQGAAGDLSPNPARGRDPQAFGQALGREALDLAATIRCAADEKPTLQAREEGFRFASQYDLSNPLIQTMFASVFFPELVAFYEREYRDGIRPSLTTVLLNGRVGIVGVSGEFFCGHALSLKRRARLEHLFFLGYCNDYQQYFPTIEAAAEGGYGADFKVSPVEVGAGEKVTDRALIHLYQMRGRLTGGREQR